MTSGKTRTQAIELLMQDQSRTLKLRNYEDAFNRVAESIEESLHLTAFENIPGRVGYNKSIMRK